MPRRTTKAPANEGGGLSKILVAIALYAVAVLMIWLAVAPAQPDTAMGSISGVLRSVGGALAIGLAVIPAAVATRLIRSVKGNQMSIPHLICYIIVYLCVYAIFHAFFINTVLSTVSIRAYGNFVARSGGIGGGKLGAFLCYPLYKVIGVAGDIFAFLVVMVLALTGTGVIPAAVRRLAPIIADLRYRIDQRNKERESERLFAGADRPEKPTRKPSREDVFEDGRPGRDRRPQRPTRPEPARPARETRPEREGRPEREAVRTVKPSAEPDVTVRKRRVNRMPEGRSVVDPDNIKMPSHTNRPPRGTVDVAQPAEAAPEKKPRPTRPVMGEVKLGDDPVASRLNRNKVRQPRAAAPVVPEPEQPTNVDVPDEEDDLPPFDVEPVVEKPVRAPRRSGRLVEEPSALALPLDDDEDEPAPKPADDLTITPDSCDVIETSGEPEPGKPPVKRSPLRVILGEDEPEPYNYPPLDLMRLTEQEQVDHQSGDLEKADLLIETLEEFGIHTELTGIAHGPAVTRFELKPAAGIKLSRITSLSDDIAMALAAMSVRIEAPIPGKSAVGIEIPNDKIEMVRLRDVLESKEARKFTSKIAVGLGKDNAGRYIVADIAKMPHVLIAGQTGSGKSVCINSIITSILYRATPEEVKLILVDPKMVELSVYNDVPHLICPVVTDPKKAASALDWAVMEMKRRYDAFESRHVRNIKGYNSSLKPGEQLMPQIVIVIDELADLMMVASGDVEASICRIAQLARACGMHLVIATQRPSVNVITGVIKANIPTRIAFSVASQIDSRTMIDHGGAEKLLGNGDMLFVPQGINKPMRVQGAFLSDEEVNAVVEYIKDRSETAYDEDMIEQMENAVRTDVEKEEISGDSDPRLAEAVEIVVAEGQASVSMLQRRMRVGYARAGRLIDEMQQRGIVSPAEGAKPRTVLISREEMNELFEEE